MGGLVLKFKTWRVARGLEFQIQDLPRGYYVVYKRTTPIFYCSQEVLSKIPKPIENNRKWCGWFINVIKTSLLFLINFSLVFTSTNKVNFQNYFANKLIKWFAFEANMSFISAINVNYSYLSSIKL